MNKKIIQSYVWHDGDRYFVSTMERESSAPECGRYNETIAWEWPEGQEKRGRMIFETEDSTLSISAHNDVCFNIILNGLDGWRT